MTGDCVLFHSWYLILRSEKKKKKIQATLKKQNLGTSRTSFEISDEHSRVFYFVPPPLPQGS